MFHVELRSPFDAPINSTIHTQEHTSGTSTSERSHASITTLVLNLCHQRCKSPGRRLQTGVSRTMQPRSGLDSHSTCWRRRWISVL